MVQRSSPSSAKAAPESDYQYRQSIFYKHNIAGSAPRSAKVCHEIKVALNIYKVL